MRRSAMVVAMLGALLCVCSLWLPTMTLELPGWHHDVRGLEWPIRLLLLMDDAPHDPRTLVLVMHGLTNLLMLLSLIVLLAGRAEGWRWLAHLMLAATLFNASIVWWLKGLRVGYFVWALSFAIITATLYFFSKPNRLHSDDVV